MVIRFKPKFDKAALTQAFEANRQAIYQDVINRMVRIGEGFVKNAREIGEYRDVTGNLRNSIGYIIIQDGNQLFDNFKKSARIQSEGSKKVSKGQDEGVEKGRSFAIEVGKRFPKGVALICVAGMDYAAAVEARGKDVITVSSEFAKEALVKSMQQLAKKIA